MPLYIVILMTMAYKNISVSENLNNTKIMSSMLLIDVSQIKCHHIKYLCGFKMMISAHTDAALCSKQTQLKQG